MLLEEAVQDLILHLLHHRRVQIPVNGSDIRVALCPAEETLALKTLIYQGSNYLPGSVRQSCMNEKQGPFSSLLTQLSVDEESFQVFLHYVGSTSELEQDSFLHLLEDFSHLAEQWRLYLDDQDRRDLVYVRAN